MNKKKPTKAGKRNIQAWGRKLLRPPWLALGIVFVLIVAAGAYSFASRSSYSTPPNTSAYKEVAWLIVSSAPPGIDIAGDTYCDSKQLGKQTPYYCAQEGDFTTTLTAPAESTVDGQKYQFKNWDGCSESHADDKVCKVTAKHGKTTTVHAVYTKAAPPSSPKPSGTTKKSSPALPAQPQAFQVNTIVLHDPVQSYSRGTGHHMATGCDLKFTAHLTGSGDITYTFYRIVKDTDGKVTKSEDYGKRKSTITAPQTTVEYWYGNPLVNNIWTPFPEGYTWYYELEIFSPTQATYKTPEKYWCR